MSLYNITAVINGHAEGLMAHTSLLSLSRSAEAARERGLSVELLAVLDKPDSITRSVFEEYASTCPHLRIITVEHGDLGYSRNTAAQEANGEYIAFLDADDIWGINWLYSAYDSACADSRNIVWHPEVNVYFGVTQSIFVHLDMEDTAFKIASLAYTNAWTSLCFTSAKFLRSVPYAGTDLKGNIGYEDWCWNIDVLEHGGIHKVVPHTSHAIRSRNVSLVKQTTAAGCIPRPSDFFRNAISKKFNVAN
jgi:glycosyltransferase involved in cell wall biosynthesis